MPPQTTDAENRIQLIPVPSSLRRRLWYGIIGAGLFILTSSVEGALRIDYDAWQQSVSALSLGSRGWVQTVSFFVFGIIIISTVTTWRKILSRGRGAKAYPMLTLLTGFSIILCGIFQQDPAPGYDPQKLALTDPTLRGLLHLLFAAIGALCSIAGLLVMARRFAHTPLWHGWKLYSILMALVMAACVTIYAIWSTKSTGYAGTFERIALMVVPVWGMTFLVRLEAGVPFMKAIMRVS